MTTWIDLAGFTLLHFLWQGAMVWGLAALGLHLLSTAQARYALACGALLALLAAPMATAVVLTSSASASAAPATRVLPATLVATNDAAAAAMPALPPSTGGGAPGGDAPRGPVMPTLVALWLTGVFLLLARLAGGCWRIRRLRAAVLAEPVSRWQAAAQDIAHRLRLARSILVIDSEGVQTPMVIGWLRPVVILPVAAMSNLAPSQVEAILAHELAHIRRHDFVVNVLQTVAETFLFYHPAVWSISRRIRAEREHCCDDVAVEVCGDALSYAEALTEIASTSLRAAPLALAATNGSLLARVQRLLRGSPDAPSASSGRVLVAALAIALLLVAGTVRAITVVQSAPAAADGNGGDRGFGPPEVNRLIGFELFPMGKGWPTDDPRDARAWGVTIDYASGEMPMRGFTARSLIRHAYNAHGLPIVDAPAWLDEESFDLSIDSELSVVPGVGDPDAFNTVLREFLEGWLGLAVHREEREFPVYALVRERADALGPDMWPSTSSCIAGDPSLHVFSRRFCGIDNTLTSLRGEGVTIEQFVAGIRGPGSHHGPLAPDLPVVDRTGLTGRYDFTVRFGFLPIAAIGSGHPAFGALIAPFGFRSMYTALPEQLGLKLEKSTAPFEVLVIDHIERP